MSKTVKLLLALFVIMFSRISPCQACYDDDDDFYYGWEFEIDMYNDEEADEYTIIYEGDGWIEYEKDGHRYTIIDSDDSSDENEDESDSKIDVVDDENGAGTALDEDYNDEEEIVDDNQEEYEDSEDEDEYEANELPIESYDEQGSDNDVDLNCPDLMSDVLDDYEEDWDCAVLKVGNTSATVTKEAVKHYETEILLGWAKDVSSEIEIIINRLWNENRIIELANTTNCHYDATNKCIYIPMNEDFTTSGITHEIIHLLQDELGILDTSMNDHASDNEYQAYVLNFILTKACRDFATPPCGTNNTSEWAMLKKVLKGQVYRRDKNLYITRDFINMLITADHELMSEAFREYYRDIDKKGEREHYYLYHSPTYQWKWEELLIKLGFIIIK